MYVLKEALRHDAERPPYLDVVRAEYVRVRDYQTGVAEGAAKRRR